ncbi:MAG: hypothetical protein IJQ37_05880 [Clostridia bacterium]|nr:hypothetical protein [Clostridia bacterium]
MTDIISAAREFAKTYGKITKSRPKAFIKKVKSCLENLSSLAKDNNSNSVVGVLNAKALLSLKAIIREGDHFLADVVPCDYLLCSAYFDVSGGDMSHLPTFIEAISDIHKFGINELLMLGDFFALFCAVEYSKTQNDVYLRVFSSLEYVDFEKIYLKNAEVHKIFSRERAGVYKNLAAQTVRSYDENLLSLYDDEIVGAEKVLSRANSEGEHVGKYLCKKKSESGRAYFWFILVLTLLFFALCTVMTNFAVALVAVLPSYMLSKELSTLLFDKGGQALFRIEKGEELESTPCTVAIASLLCTEERDGDVFDLIEDCYLTNKNENFTFAVLGDLREAEKKTLPTDKGVIRYAVARINALNEKYGDRFALFIRRRRFALCERKYLGWERKRGAVLELCRYAKGLDGSFETVVGGERVRGAKYLLTLDSDTRPSAGAVKRLLGIMLHPQNRAVVDKKSGKVVSGYGILQPKTVPSLFSTEQSLFACFSAGDGGTDRYSSASFDLYQGIFGRGIFCGKGMIDIDAFLSVCDGFFPRERILSHDLLEGSLARAAAVSDVVFTDSTPIGAAGYFSRAERWLRGDLQALAYLSGNVRNQSGEAIKNPMDSLSKYFISDNLLRAASPLFSVALVLICSALGNFWPMLLLIYTVFPFMKAVAWNIVGIGRRSLYSARRTLGSSLVSSLFSLMSLGVYAGIFIKAVSSVAVSALVSKRGFLSWTTAAEYDAKGKNGVLKSASVMSFGFIFGAVALVFPAPAMIFGALWASFPIVSIILSHRRKRRLPSDKDREKIRSYAFDMWRFFADNVGAETAHLPPDNVQYSPIHAVAYRTSPTDIGLYFTSMLAARDFGFITTEELYRRTVAAMDSLSKMARWNGHLYNWYGLPSLEVVGTPFISSVDSGNFVTCVTSFCRGAEEYVGEYPDLSACIKKLTSFAAEADFESLIDKKRGLLSIGYDAAACALSSSCYDTFMSESRTTSYYLESVGVLPDGYCFSLGRKYLCRGFFAGAASWSGTAFEYFMPSLFMPSPKNSLIYRSQSFARRVQKRRSSRVPGKKYSVFGVSESCYFEFDNEMIYQYRAFGLDGLALDPRAHDERVISPYSTFLMLCGAHSSAQKNLSRLAGAGMYGKYGFYEALDLDGRRVGDGYAIIKSFMSHHVGMSIVAAANYCFDGIFVKRFMSIPELRSHREILGERAPIGENPYRKKTEKTADGVRERKIYAAAPSTEKKRPPTIAYPSCAMLSNNKTRTVLSSSGHISVYDGAAALISSSSDKFSLGGGLRVTARVDGEIYLSPFPLGYVSPGVMSTFEFDCNGVCASYISHHNVNDKTYSFDVVISQRPDSESVDVSCRVGGETEKCEIALYFEPVIEEESAFEAHKSFSNLFIQSAYFKDERALIFARRSKAGTNLQKYFGVSCSSADEVRYASSREKMLPLKYGEEDISRLLEKELPYSDGAVIVPSCFYCVGFNGARKTAQTRFSLGFSHDRDDLLYLLSSAPRGTCNDISKLQFAVSGADETTAELERFILSKIHLGDCGVRSVGPIEALSKKPMNIDGFWRHGISGDCDIICAAFYDAKTQSEKLSELLRLFKFARIRGLRFDLAIICTDDDRYNLPNVSEAKAAVKREGVSAFVGCRAGVFIVDEEELSFGERAALTESAAAYFDLSLPFSFYTEQRSGVNSDAILRQRLLVGHNENKERKDREYKIDAGGITIKKGCAAPPWAHVIASENFGTVVSENSLGFTFFSNSSLSKITPHSFDGVREDDGEKLIIRIKEPGGFDDFDAAACADTVIFGDGFAEYKGNAKNIKYNVSVHLDGKLPSKIVDVTLSCDGETDVDVIYAVIPCAGAKTKLRETYIGTSKERNAVFFSRFIERGAQMRCALSCSGKKASVITDKTALLTYGKLFGEGGDICAVCEKINFVGEHKTEFRLSAAKTDFALEKIVGGNVNVSEKTRSTLASPTVMTGDRERDILVNRLLPYQTVVSRLFARAGLYQVGGAFGFRDQLQDVIPLIPYAPHLARRQIIYAACHQYEDGSVMHWWHQSGYPHAGIRSRCSDDSAWLSLVLCEYVTKTGDVDILGVKTPYLSSPPLAESETERYERAPHSDKTATVLEHAKGGLIRTFETGAHDLSLIGGGDWNDGMNRVGRGGRGESVWLSLFSSICAFRLALIYDMIGDEKTSEYLKQNVKVLIASSKRAFDGAWFARGYYDDGSPLGVKGCDECAVDIMPQAFAAIAAATVDGTLYGDAKTALENASGILFDKKSGVFRLLWPPFDDGDASPGYIKGYVPGIRENGGQYTHAAVFAALGMLSVGMNREGAEVLFALDPTKKDVGTYKIEPYVLAGDVYSNKDHVGRGGWSWYTGAAGWYRTVFIEALCGYRQYPTGFSLFPRLSDIFDSFELVVEHEDTVYRVKVRRSEREFIECDGDECENFFPFDGGEHSVSVFTAGVGFVPPEKNDRLTISGECDTILSR